MKQIIIFLLFTLMLVSVGSAATISGTIYNYDLAPVQNALITINTNPEQHVVAKEGTYTLHVPAGKYTIQVSNILPTGREEKSTANITVSTDGEYTYDFILFLEIENFEEPALDNITIEEEPTKTNWPLFILLIIIIVGIIGVLVYFKRQLTKEVSQEIQEEDVLLKSILQFIKKEKRTTQKTIRQHFPHSEATISLALSSLEHDNKIEKIKKGRSNIICYQQETKK